MNIVVAVDLRSSSQTVIKEATALAKAYQAELKLLVVESPEESASQHQEHEKRLAQLVSLVQEEGVKASYHTAQGRPGPEIVEYAREVEARFIVKGLHGANPLLRLMGSVSSDVMQDAPCTLVFVPS